MIRLICISIALSAVTACGFRPLYGDAGFNGVVEGQNITIGEIPGRSGYTLRRNLMQELSIGVPGLDEPAFLTVTFDEKLTRAALLADGGVSRSFFGATGRYVLETESGAISGSVNVEVPYAATATPYTDVSAQIDVSTRAMRELARQIADDLRIQVQNLK
ncbi:hypothetical protein WNY37_01875 [Henriciella sp. AS95]|uniref:hypothetical protein n=1 Tax=Henriciella sp. AS95 TaxID=3135782 RepID=UPI003175BE3B